MDGCLLGANNGLSVSTLDPTLAVLGQDVGQTGAPATWLSDREQPMNGFKLTFLGSAGVFGIQPDSSLLQGGLGSADEYLAWTGKPNNYGQDYSEPPPGFGQGDLFTQGWEVFHGVNASGRPNVVGQLWAYNGTLGGGRNNTNEAAFQFRTETHFEDAGSGIPYQFELHLPEFTDQGGERHRLWSIYPDKTGVTPAAWVSESSGVGFLGWNDKEQEWCYIMADGGLFRLLNNVPGTGHFPQITLGSLASPVNGIPYPGPAWDLQIIHQVFDIIFGRPDLARSDNAMIKMADSLQVGVDNTEPNNRSLNVYGALSVVNKIAGIQAMSVQQSGTGKKIIDVLNNTNEVLQINIGDVRLWTDIQLMVGSTAAPTAMIEIAGSSGEAGHAPFKFNDGPLLLTPEDRTFEVFGGVLYYSFDGVRKAVALV